MRKLLSFVIVAMMIVSMVVPAFALSEAPAAPDPAENHINIWVEDAELNYDETNSVDVYVSISDNTDGFEYMKFFLVYPKCLTFVEMAAVDFAEEEDALTNADATEHTTLNQQFLDALEEAGYAADYDPLEDGKYKWVSPLFDFELTEKIGGKKVSVDCFENGQILKVTFEYDASLNTEFGDTLPIIMYDAPESQLHCYRKGYEYSDELFVACVHGGEIKIKTSACSHVPGDPVKENVVPATCTEDGSYDLVTYCTLCKIELSRQVGVVESALGHDLGEAYVYAEPTPESDGISRRECSRCDYYEDTPIPYVACVHDISAEFVAPTATEAGSVTYTCSKCDFEEVKELPAYGQFDIAFENITVNKGETGDADLVLTNSAYGVDVLRVLVYWDGSEDYVTEIKNGELFDDAGFEYAYLSEEEASKLIAKAGIDFTHVDVGTLDFAVLYFEIADDSFAPILESGVLATLTFKDPGLGSEFSYGVINIDEPNVTYLDDENRFLGFIDYDMDDISAAVATVHTHTPAEAVEDPATRVEPDCTTPGSHDMVVYCSECKEELSREVAVEIPANGHTPKDPVEERRTESTCTAAGSYYSVVYCSVCEEKISEEKVDLPLADHTKGQTVKILTAPTATEKGVIRYACSVCGNFVEDFDEEIPETGALAIAIEGGTYNAGDTIAIPVTLTNGNYGVDAVRFLVYWDEGFGEPEFAIGDEVFTAESDEIESAIIDASAAAALIADAGITFDVEGKAFAVVYIATGDEDFTARTSDGKLATITFEGPEGGGDFEVGILNIENPNVTYYGADGSFSGFIDYELGEIAPAEITVHDYEVVVTDPTCTEGGYTTHTCAHCGDVFVTDEVDALGHIPADEWEVTEATPDADGLRVLRCKTCGEIIEQEIIARKVIDLQIVPSAMIVDESSYPEGTLMINNETRVINLIAKKDQAKAVFQLKLEGAGTSAFMLDEAAFEAGNAVKIGSKVYDNATDAAGIRYFICYAANGFNQSFKVDVTYEGDVYEYTVNVTFLHTPAMTSDSVVLGYNGARSATLDTDDKLIHIESKDAQGTVSFNLKRVKGVTIRVDPESTDMPQVVQYINGAYAQIDPADESTYNDDAIVYFKVVRDDQDEQVKEFDIVLTYYNGQTETYHVEVVFNA